MKHQGNTKQSEQKLETGKLTVLVEKENVTVGFENQLCVIYKDEVGLSKKDTNGSQCHQAYIASVYPVM